MCLSLVKCLSAFDNNAKLSRPAEEHKHVIQVYEFRSSSTRKQPGNRCLSRSPGDNIGSGTIVVCGEKELDMRMASVPAANSTELGSSSVSTPPELAVSSAAEATKKAA